MVLPVINNILQYLKSDKAARRKVRTHGWRICAEVRKSPILKWRCNNLNELGPHLFPPSSPFLRAVVLRQSMLCSARASAGGRAQSAPSRPDPPRRQSNNDARVILTA